MLKFRCSGCNQKIAVEKQLAGRRVKCSGCGAVVVVPTSEVSPQAQSDAFSLALEQEQAAKIEDDTEQREAEEWQRLVSQVDKEADSFRVNPDSNLPIFRYQADRRTGGAVEGRIQAKNREDAARQLRAKGLFPQPDGITEVGQDCTISRKPEIPTLISCKACGNQIATSASTCPKCGAPNTWLHPEIQRFVEHLHTFNHMPAFQIRYHSYVLSGSASVMIKQKTEFGSGEHLLSHSVVKHIAKPSEGVSFIVLLLNFLGFGMSYETPELFTFSIDFSVNPPLWNSNNDEFWRDVRRFFVSR